VCRLTRTCSDRLALMDNDLIEHHCHHNLKHRLFHSIKMAVMR
jgi:hypothetical protein